MTATAEIIGFDPGMGAIKLYGKYGGIELPSQVATNGRSHLATGYTGLGRRTPPSVVHTEAGEFYVGLGAHDYGRPVENLDYDRLTGSPEIRALLYGALSAYFKQTKKTEEKTEEKGEQPEDKKDEQSNEKHLILSVGLPIETLSGEQAEANAAAVRTWLQGHHRWTVNQREYSANVEKVLITPQPVGMLFDYVLDEEGNFLADRKSALTDEVGVVTIGFNTLELLVIRDKKPVDSFTAGRTVGVRRLLELVNRQGLYSLGELDSQLRAGKLNYRSEAAVWAREVGGAIENYWGQKHTGVYRRFKRILLGGGGAILLKNEMQDRFGSKAFVPDQPVLATARGLYKRALMTQQRKKE
jgi:hypothetical protein